ncbi:MAG: YitT family protein [Clostridiales bacterium]|nr:YitT family protein [Clostridiales bacterium]
MKTPVRVFLALLGAFIQAVGLSNIHAFADVTEGGVLGATLLLEHWFAISPALSALLLNAACYLFGWRTLGKGFLKYSILCGLAYSVFYAALEPFAPLWPGLVASPLWSAIVGAVFIGVGAGLCVRVGGAPGGDDALAMALARLTKIDIQWIYLFTDVVVLGLSVTYIPLTRIGYSLLTVILSGQFIGLIQKLGVKKA